MKAYKCDLCLEYCDDVYQIELPRYRNFHDAYPINEICDDCVSKLEAWIDQNAGQGKREPL